MDLKKSLYVVGGMDSFDLAQGPVAGCRGHESKTTGSIKMTFLDYMSCFLRTSLLLVDNSLNIRPVTYYTPFPSNVYYKYISYPK
jgi:hypothetical protein